MSFSRVRAGLQLTAAQTSGRAIKAVLIMTVKVEGADCPACIAEVVVLYR